MTDWPGRSFVLAILLVPLIVLIAGLVIYAIRSRGSGGVPVDEELRRRGSSPFLGQTLRQGFAWMARPVERMLSDGSVSPDLLSLVGCFLCCSGAAVVAAGDLTVGGLLVLSSAGLDYLDGRVARARGVASAAGEFLDSTLDRFSDAACLGAAAFLMREQPWTLGAALVALGAAAVVPYARAKAASLGHDLRSGMMQRPERVVLYSAAAIFGAVVDPWWPGGLLGPYPTFSAAIWILALATSVTAIGRTRRGLRMLRGDGGR